MIKIGLTGGIGSGKSTVANFFIELGVPVYFADDEAKKLMSSSKKIKNKLIKAFGEKAFEDGKLNRPYLAEIVFNDKDKLRLINDIVHPEIAKHFLKWVKKQKGRYVIQENAILFENNTASKFDYVITVTAPLDEKINRIQNRDSTSKESILARMNNQLDDAVKIKSSDFVIDNIKLTDTKEKVKKLHKKFLKIRKKQDKS